eukprot:scaffold360932_cov31-Prasinocladus_malaysianus.AAC.1
MQSASPASKVLSLAAFMDSFRFQAQLHLGQNMKTEADLAGCVHSRGIEIYSVGSCIARRSSG